MIRRRKPGRRPPKTFCQGCGTEGYRWSAYWYCDRCREEIDALRETGWVRRMQVENGNRTEP